MNIDLADILRTLPATTCIYNCAIGYCHAVVMVNNNIICYTDNGQHTLEYTHDGKHIYADRDGEMQLFPARNYKSWEDWQNILFNVGDIVMSPSGGTYLITGAETVGADTVFNLCFIQDKIIHNKNKIQLTEEWRFANYNSVLELKSELSQIGMELVEGTGELKRKTYAIFGPENMIEHKVSGIRYLISAVVDDVDKINGYYWVNRSTYKIPFKDQDEYRPVPEWKVDTIVSLVNDDSAYYKILAFDEEEQCYQAIMLDDDENQIYGNNLNIQFRDEAQWVEIVDQDLVPETEYRKAYKQLPFNKENVFCKCGILNACLPTYPFSYNAETKKVTYIGFCKHCGKAIYIEN